MIKTMDNLTTAAVNTLFRFAFSANEPDFQMDTGLERCSCVNSKQSDILCYFCWRLRYMIAKHFLRYKQIFTKIDIRKSGERGSHDSCFLCTEEYQAIRLQTNLSTQNVMYTFARSLRSYQ